ncbi:MAG TPA: hypothetical protein VGQ15_00995, partial [Gaiellaceae bacterium]|nr:hypothetical protein [Gaiellaceae bacterium]
ADPVGTAKALSKVARDTRVLVIRGGILAGKPVSSDEVESLATLPPADVLRGQVLGAIVAPVQALAGLVAAPLTNLVGLVDARIEQLGGEGEGAAPEAETPIEETTPEAPAAEAATEEPTEESTEEKEEE